MTLQEPTIPQTLRVLFAAAEADPIIKVGGLGDVTGSLPWAIQALDSQGGQGLQMDVRLVIPFYPAIRRRGFVIEPVVNFSVPTAGGAVEAQAYQTVVNGMTIYLIDGAPVAHEGPVYSQITREDGEKFTFFSLALLELARALDWQPDILHANDWHTAIAVYMLAVRRGADPFFEGTRSVLTVHNLPFMGAGTDQALADYGIPPLDDPRLPPWGAYQPLPMGLATADCITTVSPTYARETLLTDCGCGLEQFLRLRAGSMAGILNGLDTNAWDPRTDKALPAKFSREELEKRIANKQALVREFGLPPNIDLPLLIFIGRMDRQKGVDLAIEALREISGLPWQAILLGTGDPTLEEAARLLEEEFPYRVRAAIRFDTQLARRMYAGGDMLLMPSRYEPCGLAQMIAMRYGCIPVVRATGGLRDTVQDHQTAENSSGFIFDDASPEALAAALRRAIAAFGDPRGWKARQDFAMQQDFSWQRSAEAYVQMYQRILSQPVVEQAGP